MGSGGEMTIAHTGSNALKLYASEEQTNIWTELPTSETLTGSGVRGAGEKAQRRARGERIQLQSAAGRHAVLPAGSRGLPARHLQWAGLLHG